VTEISLDVNGQRHRVEAAPDTPLLYVLRNELGLTAAKFGCGQEQCHACAVIADGAAVPTCVEPVASFAGKRITTLEGIGGPEDLHPVQEALLDEQAAQCGFCIPGVVVAAVALLERTPHPSEEEIRETLSPQLCRCGSQPRIMRALRRVAA
jgi:nicotinate dehydrogenase subunit A